MDRSPQFNSWRRFRRVWTAAAPPKLTRQAAILRYPRSLPGGAVSPVSIENPILNSPFREPTRHWRVQRRRHHDRRSSRRRRSSTYFMPIAEAEEDDARRSADARYARDLDGGADDRERLHQPRPRRSRAFRRAGYPGVTPITRELLEYWTDPTATQAAVLLPDRGARDGDLPRRGARPDAALDREPAREENEAKNAGLYRLAFKMATGSRQDRRDGDAHRLAGAQQAREPPGPPLLATRSSSSRPGITIRDRLRVLLPNDPANYYQERDLVTPDQLARLRQANILITNFHAFLRRDTLEAATLTKKVLAGPDGDPDRYNETPDQMVRRVCRTLDRSATSSSSTTRRTTATRRARRRAGGAEKLTADERAEAKRNDEAARVWLNGLRGGHSEARHPVGLRPLGHAVLPEGLRLPGGDAVPVGRVGLQPDRRDRGRHRQDPARPGLPTTPSPATPVFRELWPRIRELGPRKGRSDGDLTGDPILAEGARGGARQPVRQLPSAPYDAWQRGAASGTPPVFIVVCNNTSLSKLVFDWIAGWEKHLADGETVAVPGSLPLFSNVERGALERPAATRSSSTRAARVGRGDGPRVQEDRRGRDRGVQARVRASATPAARRRRSPTRTSCARS